MHGIINRNKISKISLKSFVPIYWMSYWVSKNLPKSVLHSLQYTANVYLSRCSTDLRLIFGHSVCSRKLTKIKADCPYLNLVSNTEVNWYICPHTTGLSLADIWFGNLNTKIVKNKHRVSDSDNRLLRVK